MLVLAFAVVAALLIMWLAGVFTPKIGPAAETHAAAAERRLADADRDRLAEVASRSLPRIETAVGTIRAVHETSVASKLIAKVVQVNVIAGQRVAAGEVLVRFDDEELRARVEQTETAIAAAQGELDHAQVIAERVRSAHASGAATSVELNRAETTLNTARAELERARQARLEAATVLGYTTITSPIDGVVVEKYVEPGDTVLPGQVLVKLIDPTRMQLVARVRESLAERLEVGKGVNVAIDAIERTCLGTVSEIVPEAESTSRAFTVKVTGPCPPGVYAGMFGRLLIPLDDEQVVLVPRPAVRQVGQLQIVDVVEDGDVLRRRAVETGRVMGDEVEILSGLRPGEVVVLGESR